MRTDLTAERLHELLDYDPLTGIFIWTTTRSGMAVRGSIAGTVGRQGHRRIAIDDVRYMAHRLAWLYVHGTWPPSDLDHENQDPDDNRIDNLRPATSTENRENVTPAQRNNRVSRVRNVYPARDKWKVMIMSGGVSNYFGIYPTIAEAEAVALAEKSRLHTFWSPS